MLSPKDLKVEAWPLQSQMGGMLAGLSRGVRITYIPTGQYVTVTEHRRQTHNKNEALKRLEDIIQQIMHQE